MAFPIPASYGEWRHCITEVCGLALTEAFIHQRLAALENPDDYMTRNVIALYGEPPQATDPDLVRPGSERAYWFPCSGPALKGSTW